MSTAEAAGKAAKDEFMTGRFQNQSSVAMFFDPFKKMQLLTMEANNNKAKITSTQEKVNYILIVIYYILPKQIKKSAACHTIFYFYFVADNQVPGAG